MEICDARKRMESFDIYVKSRCLSLSPSSRMMEESCNHLLAWGRGYYSHRSLSFHGYAEGVQCPLKAAVPQLQERIEGVVETTLKG